MTKDVKIAADLAEGLEFDAPIVQLASARFTEATHNVGGDKDHTVAFKFWREHLAKGRGKG